MTLDAGSPVLLQDEGVDIGPQHPQAGLRVVADHLGPVGTGQVGQDVSPLDGRTVGAETLPVVEVVLGPALIRQVALFGFSEAQPGRAADDDAVPLVRSYAGVEAVSEPVTGAARTLALDAGPLDVGAPLPGRGSSSSANSARCVPLKR